MDLDDAIARHAEWKTKFRRAISGHETMDAATISGDSACQLGKWLHGEAKMKFATHDAYTECVAKHAAFHAEAGKVAQTINQKKFVEAEAMLNAGTAYAGASSAVGVAIMRLKKETGL